MSTEHRRHPRYSVEVAAEVTLGARTFAAATQNISEGGVALLLDQALEEGAEIRLALFLTQDGIEDPDEAPFEARAFVAWTAPSDDGTHVAGVRFGAVSAAQRKQLARFLAATHQSTTPAE
jgi:c-di-GMP-binding flagellar brake protein YcgR